MTERDVPIVDVTTVTDTTAVIHVTPIAPDAPVAVHRFSGLAPATEHELVIPETTGRTKVRTLASPRGARLARFATVNDVHFGETVAGQIDSHDIGPLRRSPPGAEPYPEVMNHAAVAEIADIEPDAVVVKGDLSLDGAATEWAAFEACYREPFGDRLHVVRGNHDAYRYQSEYSGDQVIELNGLTVALLDTVIPGATTGDVTEAQADWLDATAAASTQPVLAMGHHQQWISGSGAEPHEAKRSDDYFGIHPDGSDRLDAVCARQSAIIAYTCGHTHRHRVRTMTASRVPSIEIGCTKDFPGTWAEYRVHDNAVMQVVHRMSTPAALAWSEPCRILYRDFGIDYSTYALGTLGERCFLIDIR